MSNIDTIASRLALHQAEFTEMMHVVSATVHMGPGTLLKTLYGTNYEWVLTDRFVDVPLVLIAMAPYLEEGVAIFSFEYIERHSQKNRDLKRGMFIIHELESVAI